MQTADTGFHRISSPIVRPVGIEDSPLYELPPAVFFIEVSQRSRSSLQNNTWFAMYYTRRIWFRATTPRG